MNFPFKKIYSVIFFLMVFAAFLNTLSFAKEASATKGRFRSPTFAEFPKRSKGEFIQSLILSDYNQDSIITNLGGLSGGKEELPGIAYAGIVSDNGLRRGDSGAAAKIDYDVSKPGEYSFYWIKLGKELPGRIGVTAVLDLIQYNYLSFWIKGMPDLKKMKVELHQETNGNGTFEYGKDITSVVYTDLYMNGPIGAKWKKVLIPLADFAAIKDWNKMLELVFVFENKLDTPKGTVYIDDILFGYRPSIVLMAKGTRDINTPIESSFKVNDVGSKRCLTFKGVNTLSINAETSQENPFLENVRFEYSVDKGSTWRVIGVDYDTSKKTYKVSWQPDNSRELARYQVRAVAADIWGNEKQTGVLIDCPIQPMSDDEFLNMVENKAFDFFNDHQDQKTGLFADTTGGGDASIASTGFGLAALCVGAERGWITKEDARKRALLALDAFLPKSEGAEPLSDGRFGFFYHFLNIHTGKRASRSEISTVDTAILAAGALTAGEYFGGEVKNKAKKLYENVEWNKFIGREKGPLFNLFSMGWSPERGFLESYWDYYTDETILINLLAIGSPTHPVAPDVFYSWVRNKGAYNNGQPFIYSWHGALFSYQYANVWFDFRDIIDKQGVSWYENSKNATLANRQFCIDNADKLKGFGPNCWGITSMARPQGYTMHFGVPPAGNGEPEYDDTISPTGPAGSIVFTPYLSLSALKHMYINYPRLWGQYGLRDSFNLEKNWYSPIYYGIGEAMILLPIENFRSSLLWKNFMKNFFVQDALKKAGFTKVKPQGKSIVSS